MTTTDHEKIATASGRRNLGESCDDLKMDPNVGQLDFLHVVRGSSEDCPSDWRACTATELAHLHAQNTGTYHFMLILQDRLSQVRKKQILLLKLFD